MIAEVELAYELNRGLLAGLDARRAPFRQEPGDTTVAAVTA